MQSVYFLSEKLGKFKHEIEEELTNEQFNEYLAYYQWKAEMEEKELKKARKR